MKKLKQKGQAVIEFAVVLPLFVIFLFGIIYCGMLFYDYISLSNLARSAAREGAIVKDFDNDSSIRTQIETYYSTKTNSLLTKLYEPVPYSGSSDPGKLVKVELVTGDPAYENNSIVVTINMQRNVSSGLMEIILPEDYTIQYFMRRDEQSGGST